MTGGGAACVGVGLTAGVCVTVGAEVPVALELVLEFEPAVSRRE